MALPEESILKMVGISVIFFFFPFPSPILYVEKHQQTCYDMGREVLGRNAMERSDVMSAYERQLEKINQILRDEITLLDTLPEEEAKVQARKNLAELGLAGGNSEYAGRDR